MPVLFATVLIDLIGFGILIPLLPFMVPKMGGTMADVFMITAIYSVCTAIVGPYWGKLSDRIGRKPVILLCLFGNVLSYVALAFTTELWMIYLARAFGGAMAGNFGVASATAADMSTPENRAKSMGRLGAAFGLGMVIGPFLGGFLAGDEVNHMRPALVAAALSSLAIICGFIFLKETLPPEKRGHLKAHRAEGRVGMFELLRNTGNGLLVSQFMLHNFCVSLSTTMFPLWVAAYLDWGPKEVAIVLGSVGLFMALIQATLVGPLSRSLGQAGALTAGISVMASGFVLAAFATTAPTMVLAFLLAICGATMCTPMLNTLTTLRTPFANRGQMMGTTGSFSACGRVAGPCAGAVLVPVAGFTMTWLVAAGVAGAFLAWGFSEVSKSKRHADVPEH